jgi:coenzyme F420 hydrogenase subunit beta
VTGYASFFFFILIFPLTISSPMGFDRVDDKDSFRSKTESAVFGRPRNNDEIFGVCRRLAVAQTTNPEVARLCQDGGVATTLLLTALERDLIDSALVTVANDEKPLYPVPSLAVTSTQILAAAGSKYTCSKNPLTIASEAADQGKTNVALVGMPCHIMTLRRQQMTDPAKFGSVKLSIGLLCSGCFRHELITEFIQQKLGIDSRGIVKMNIKGKLLITTKAGTISVPLSEINSYKAPSCGGCIDFSSELADVSVGGLGLEGWSFVVIRSETGEELFSIAEKAKLLRVRAVTMEDSSLKRLVQLSLRKKQKIEGKSERQKA